MGRATSSTTKSKWSMTGPNRCPWSETPATTVWTKTQSLSKGYFVSIWMPLHQCGIRHLDSPRPVQFSRCLFQNYPVTEGYVIYHSAHTATVQTKTTVFILTVNVVLFTNRYNLLSNTSPYLPSFSHSYNRHVQNRLQYSQGCRT